EPLGQAKVRDARLIAGVHQDVGGLEIAVQDALPMRVVDGFRNELDVTRRFRGRQRAVPHESGEVLSLDVIHREIMLTLMDAYVVNGDDVRVLEKGGSRNLASKPLNDLR